jgi:hypothetical protein
VLLVDEGVALAMLPATLHPARRGLLAERPPGGEVAETHANLRDHGAVARATRRARRLQSGSTSRRRSQRSSRLGGGSRLRALFERADPFTTTRSLLRRLWRRMKATSSIRRGALASASSTPRGRLRALARSPEASREREPRATPGTSRVSTQPPSARSPACVSSPSRASTTWRCGVARRGAPGAHQLAARTSARARRAAAVEFEERARASAALRSASCSTPARSRSAARSPPGQLFALDEPRYSQVTQPAARESPVPATWARRAAFERGEPAGATHRMAVSLPRADRRLGLTASATRAHAESLLAPPAAPERWGPMSCTSRSKRTPGRSCRAPPEAARRVSATSSCLGRLGWAP